MVTPVRLDPQISQISTNDRATLRRRFESIWLIWNVSILTRQTSRIMSVKFTSWSVRPPCLQRLWKIKPIKLSQVTLTKFQISQGVSKTIRLFYWAVYIFFTHFLTHEYTLLSTCWVKFWDGQCNTYACQAKLSWPQVNFPSKSTSQAAKSRGVRWLFEI